ncbi:MAG: SCO4848 family membrane protein [Thermoleophilia bacterium]
MRSPRIAGGLLLAAAAWTVFVWVNRLVNLARDDRSAAFIAVHAVLALVSLGLAVPVGIIGWRLRRRGSLEG